MSCAPTRSEFCIANSCAYCFIEAPNIPCYKLHIPFLLSRFLQRIHPIQKHHVTFCNKLVFYGEQLAYCPASKLEDNPLLAVCLCIFIIFACNLRMHHVVVMDPHKVVPSCFMTKILCEFSPLRCMLHALARLYFITLRIFIKDNKLCDSSCIFCQPSLTCFLLGPSTILSYLFSHTFTLCFFP